ncbi:MULTISPECIES: hypothetical protein [Bacillaceae]|uniref:hypothetical protein n=1 Tax=Metabacillus sp. 22489 TaxID=3453928 RepID=UPI000BA607C0|nr:hypothetical protein CHH83_18875 [Bacillus sp. 7586-K]
MELRDYEVLPDILSVEEIEFMFKEVLEKYYQGNIEKNKFLKILNELTDRQVMTYELLNTDIKSKIDEELCKLWNTNSYEVVDVILSIVLNLGLEKCFHQIKDLLESIGNMSQEIKVEIEDAIEEVGDNISNPYFNLEK